ncbi:hypothetical protein [Archaeoglobus sp.]|uniref:hypothetical protein n=1 Tax=Archaeoglobus sp. TaxID=1872626 RepID=UPI0024ABDC9C|nr:hypothetical protein [Archaeoglobus sp.]MDI3498952.1 hypothetical protein [Archaeoglobus sp.]
MKAYQELGRAAHYLMDVGNPYHSNLANPDKIKHDFYEEYVENHVGDWHLDLEAYQAPKISISNPKDAVKSLAKFSHDFRDELDSAIEVEWVGPYYFVSVKDEKTIKQVTLKLVRKTAGYTKGLIEYFNNNPSP